MSDARERLDRIETSGYTQDDANWMYDALRRALEALESSIGEPGQRVGADRIVRKALADIDALAKEGTGKP